MKKMSVQMTKSFRLSWPCWLLCDNGVCARATGRKRAAETDENRLFRVKGKFWFLLLSYWGFIYITGEMITREHRTGLLIQPTKQFMNDHDDNRTSTVGFVFLFFASFFFIIFQAFAGVPKVGDSTIVMLIFLAPGCNTSRKKRTKTNK